MTVLKNTDTNRSFRELFKKKPNAGNKHVASRSSAMGPEALKSVAGSQTQIWRSRLSWRITLAVFLTILTVQVAIMSQTINQVRSDELGRMVEEARSTIITLIEKRSIGIGNLPFEDEDIAELLSFTRVQGLSVYSALDGQLLKNYGNATIIRIDFDSERGSLNLPDDYYSNDGSFFELLLIPRNLGGAPYYLTVKMDSGHVEQTVRAYVEQTILITLLMSAFVTTVLMIALGHWLLEPILFLRENLKRASDSPENPNIERSPYDTGDEIGSAIDIAYRLIKQNAENIRRIKSAAEDQIHNLAFFDQLTKLPNRTQLLQNLHEMVRGASDEPSAQFAVIALDLDHFKDINDSMGHNVGDAILKAVGKRLRTAMPEQAIVARSGEDEFSVTMKLIDGGDTTKDIADKIAKVIRSEPFKVFNENFQVRASIGISTYPDDGADPVQVLKNADIALNRAKEEGRDTIKEYSEDFDRAVQQRFQTLRDLRDALEHDQLRLHYQPQFDLKTGAVIGAEALIRWWKPDNSKEGGSFIPPFDFIPIAEQSGLIVPIGEWVMREACIAASKWQNEGHNIRIAVNVSGVQFFKSDIVAITEQILKETGVNPQLLEMEVTESIFMEDITHAVTTLQNLHALGVEIAIDDFGTGYSSLSYLRQFPIDRLKIDQSFIRNALNNPDDASIARTIIRLGHSLNLNVIAEGVETKEHEAFLVAEECDEVQGYRYSRPVPLEEFADFINKYDGNLTSFDI